MGGEAIEADVGAGAHVVTAAGSGNQVVSTAGPQLDVGAGGKYVLVTVITLNAGYVVVVGVGPASVTVEVETAIPAVRITVVVEEAVKEGAVGPLIQTVNITSKYASW